MSTLQNRLQLDATAGNNLVPDPGNGGTIDPNRHFDGVCELTGGSGAQTRVLPAAGSFPVGMKLMLVKKSGAGVITVTQAGSLQFDAKGATSLTLDAVGSSLLVEVLHSASGAKAWRLIAANRLGTNDHILIDPLDGGTINPGVLPYSTVVLITEELAETRVLAAASGFAYGTRVVLIYADGDDGITVTQAGALTFDLDDDADIVLDTAGAWAEFVVGSNAAGAKAWRLGANNLAASGG